MPRYEMVCSSCGYSTEVMCSYGDAEITRCETCDTPMDIVMSPTLLRGLPTPIHHGKTIRTEDPGFNAEWDSIE